MSLRLNLGGHDIMRYFLSVFLSVNEGVNLVGTACADTTTLCASEKDYEVCEMV